MTSFPDHPEKNDAVAPLRQERIAKFLAKAGVASRREAEDLILQGLVTVNGETIRHPAFFVTEADKVTCRGQAVLLTEPLRLFCYHKPVGLICTRKDPQNRPTIFDALPEGLPRLISVGRLDLNSEGLLLLTTDGTLSRKLELPSSLLIRRYRVRVYGKINQKALASLKKGITVEGVRYGPIEAVPEVKTGANSWLIVSLTEGKNREIRKVMNALGLEVSRLIRISYGPFLLEDLKPGAVEEIPSEKFRALLPPKFFQA